MDNNRELELRIRVLEKIVKEIVSQNPAVVYPDKPTIAQFKMEAFNELRKKYPGEKIDYPK